MEIAGLLTLSLRLIERERFVDITVLGTPLPTYPMKGTSREIINCRNAHPTEPPLFFGKRERSPRSVRSPLFLATPLIRSAEL